MELAWLKTLTCSPVSQTRSIATNSQDRPGRRQDKQRTPDGSGFISALCVEVRTATATDTVT